MIAADKRRITSVFILSKKGWYWPQEGEWTIRHSGGKSYDTSPFYIIAANCLTGWDDE